MEAKKRLSLSPKTIQKMIKEKELSFIDQLADLSTRKERKRFKKYRIPMVKYAMRIPKFKNVVIRTSPKKKPATPPRKKTPPKKKTPPVNLDKSIDQLIEKVTIVQESAKLLSGRAKKESLEFLNNIKEQIDNLLEF